MEITGDDEAGDEAGGETIGGEDDKAGVEMTEDDGAGGDESGGDTTGGEATGDDVKVKTDVDDKEEAAGVEAEVELPGGVRGIVTGAVPVAGTVCDPVWTEMFPVGIL